MRNIFRLLGSALMVAAIVAAILALVSLGILILWNLVVVSVFGAAAISFLQAFGLLLVVIAVRNLFFAQTHFKTRR